MQNTPKNIHTKFSSNWSSSIRGKDFRKNNIKNSKQRQKRAITPTWLNGLKRKKLTIDRTYHAEHFYPHQNFAELNALFWRCMRKKKLLTDPYVLSSVTAAMFLDRSKISTSGLCRIHKGTFILSLVPIGQVVSKEIFERNNIKNSIKKWFNGLQHGLMDYNNKNDHR